MRKEMKIYSKPTRVDPEFAKEMREIARIRISKGFAKLNSKEMGVAEMTRLLRRSPNYRFALRDLMTKPKKEDLI